MKIGLIDADDHKFPNLALMKISAWHKAQGDSVEWHWNWGNYDKVYMSKVFDKTYSEDIDEPYNTKELIKGGTGYDLENKRWCNNKFVYRSCPNFEDYKR